MKRLSLEGDRDDYDDGGDNDDDYNGNDDDERDDDDDGWRGWPWRIVTWHHLSWTSVICKIYT